MHEVVSISLLPICIDHFALMASSGAHVRVICLASGNGSNFKALVDAVCSGKLGNACIVRLICNQKDAHVRDRARSAGIPDTYHNMYSGGYTKKYPGSGKATSPAARESYDADLAKILLADSPSLVVCAGWMHVFSSAFLDPVASAGVSVINLHPALPGEFIGSCQSRPWSSSWRCVAL